MDLVVFNREELIATLRMLRDVALINGQFTDAESDYIESVAGMHGVIVDARALTSIDTAILARIVVEPHKRKRALQLAIVLAFVEGTPSPKAESVLKSIAQDFELTESALDVVREISKGQIALARFDMVRRVGATAFRNASFGDIIKTVLSAAGVLGGEDESIAARYRALADCAPGSFGRAFYDHHRTHGFALPGEKHGMPETAIFHDAGHVLAGYGVDPASEIQQAAFQAGFMRNDGFVFFLFGVLQFHLGIRITPIAKSEVGFFDVKRVLHAAARGAACKVDLTDPTWSLWEVKDVPLDELRKRYEIPTN